ncbi:hypothetical protein OH77DRAFT_1390950 [Trametes cingulata]|nr:hypothetical protein OH77DRAFT_1390950 [Trametes cingulata]
MNSPVDLRARDDHVRLLLDQRAARADLHGRFPSLSEFSDSPSVYSHPHFSPRPSDRSALDANVQAFRFPQSPQIYSPSLSEPRSPISDRERLNIPTASSLDLEDDPRSSAEYSSMHDGEDSSPDEEGDEEVPRISMYGPKMRFHSPAPWEEEGDEEVARDSIDEPSKRSKKKGDAGKKGWGLSRTTTNESRPSNESARSGKGKQSFETSSALSATGALAYASMSSTSLAINPSPQSLRDKLSLPRLRSRTPSNAVQLDALSTPNNNASPVSRLTSPADADADDHSLGHSSTRSSTPQYGEYTHPYANPDLVRAVNLDPPPSSPNLQASFGANRGDSNATLTDTTPSSSMSQFRSTTTLSMTPGTSMTSVNPSLSDSTSSTRVGGKGISGPIPVDKSSLPLAALSMLSTVPQSPVVQSTPMSPGYRSRENTVPAVPMGGLPAWHESGGGALKLISLEEAQAQARERSRSATAHPVISSPYASSSRTQIADPDSDGSHRGQGRARSTSAGASKSGGRHPLPMGGDSPGGSGGGSSGGGSGPHKHVVRKKSGFMRLFNGKDRDRVSPSSPPPPVPSLFASSDAFAANPPPPPLPPPQYSRPRQSSTHRVPVPSLSPSLLGEPSPPGNSPPATGATATAASGGLRDQQLSARRKAPELSIVTSSPSLGSLSTKMPYTAPLSAGANEGSHYLTPTTTVSRSEKTSNAGGLPCSAPPSKTDFVGLSIRPVSTLFSRELKEQLAVSDDSSLRTRPSLEVDTGTPTTTATAISPLSPDFASSTKSLGYGRSSDEKSGPVIADDRDQSSVIQALQEQILTARRAWQRQIWELEGQVRDLKAEVEELRAAEGNSEYCAACGRGSVHRPGVEDHRNLEELKKAGVKTGVVNRPRARTGVGSRFASGT